MKKKVLFISSTGGHLNEMMQLKELFDKYEYHIITEKTKSNLHLLDKYPKKVDFLEDLKKVVEREENNEKIYQNNEPKCIS